MLSLTSPVRTPYHRVGAAPKLLALCAFSIGAFLLRDPALLALAFAFVVLLYAAMGHLFARAGLARLRPLWPFVAVILIWHLATSDILAGIAICLRLLAVVGFANLVTMTTPLQALLDTVTGLFRPLRRFGANPALLGFAVALMIRFIPVLMARARALAEAWRARSPRRANWRLLTPVFLTVLDDADHVAEALRARGGLNEYE